ncbi:hypothetical protein [Halalkalibacter krulwichiae]|nr:hypothetical protein [Halalkalibacter krulwichiae]
MKPIIAFLKNVIFIIKWIKLVIERKLKDVGWCYFMSNGDWTT